MPKPSPKEPKAEIVNSHVQIDPEKRRSLQQQPVTEPAAGLRKTKSQSFGRGKGPKRAPPVPTIQEADISEEETSAHHVSLVVENEARASEVRTGKTRKLSRSSQRSSRSTLTYDNQGFEGNLKRTGSASTSIRTLSRAPSLQSLEVVQEQYCCCSRRTKCERRLLTVIVVLVIIVIVLVAVVSVIANDHTMSDLKAKLKL